MGPHLVAAGVGVLVRLLKRQLRHETPDLRLTRRAFARIAVWGAVGASFIAGCRRREGVPGHAADRPVPASAALNPGTLAKWARLGRVWRELNSLSRHPHPGPDVALAEYDANETTAYRLHEEMEAALDDLAGWPELRHLVEERTRQLGQYELRVEISCYLASGPVCYESGEKVADRVNELRELGDGGVLSEEVARKAAQALAVEAEYMARFYKDRADTKDHEDEWRRVETSYERGRLRPTPPSKVAGERVVELTVDKLGWLTDAESANGTLGAEPLTGEGHTEAEHGP